MACLPGLCECRKANCEMNLPCDKLIAEFLRDVMSNHIARKAKLETMEHVQQF